MSDSFDVDRWTRELYAAGWREVRLGVWRAPSGFLYRGPYGAWCQMLKQADYDTPQAPR